MKTDPGGLGTAFAAAEATPCTKVEIEWTAGNWTDETVYVLSWEAKTQMVNPIYGWLSLSGQAMGTATVTVLNDDGRYSASHAGSQAATNGIRGKHIRISCGYVVSSTPTYPTGYEWYGRIMDVPEAEVDSIVALSCHDVLSDAKRQNKSTNVYINYQTHNWIAVLMGAPVNLSFSAGSETGVMMIPYAWTDESEVLKEMRDSAASEAGALFAYSDGTVTFWNLNHWAGKTKADYGNLTLILGGYSELKPSRNYENEYNIIWSQYAPCRQGVPTVVYSLKQNITVPPMIGGVSGSRVETFNFQWPCVGFPTVPYTMNTCTAGGVPSTAVTISPNAPIYAKRWDVTFVNTDTQNEVYVTQFDVLGYPVDKRPATQYSKDLSSGKPYPRRYGLPANSYVQTEEQVRLLCDMLCDRMSTVRLQLEATGVELHPLLELGDIIGVSSTVTGVNTDCIVVGKNSRYGNGDWVMDLSLFDITGLYSSTNPFRVGSSALGASGSEAGY